MATPDGASREELTIDAAARPLLDLGALWRHRDLLRLLVWRDLRVRYTSTTLGVAWALLQPLLTAAILWVIFSKLLGAATPGGSGLLFYFSAAALWSYVAGSVQQGVSSVVAYQPLVTKVYFPRKIIPLVATASPLVDLALALLVLAALVALHGVQPTGAVLLAPAAVLLVIITVLGLNLWLSALNVRFRDVKNLVTPMLQVWFFASPIAYASSLVPEGWRALHAMNPVAWAAEVLRAAALGLPAPPAPLAPPALIAAALAMSGLLVFSRLERSFADAV